MSRTSAVFTILILAILAAVAAFFFSRQNARYDENKSKMDGFDWKVATLESDIAEAKRKIARQEQEEAETKRILDEYERRKEAKQMAFIADIVGYDSITGEVTLLVGSAVGLTTGLVFTVYRDAVRICDIRVDRVDATSSVASVVPGSKENPEMHVKPGDTARCYKANEP